MLEEIQVLMQSNELETSIMFEIDSTQLWQLHDRQTITIGNPFIKNRALSVIHAGAIMLIAKQEDEVLRFAQE